MPLNIIPFPPQAMNTTQNSILENFANIDSAFQVNHFGYNVANEGLHQKIEFPVVIDAAEIPDGSIQLFTMTGPKSEGAELAVTKQLGATTTTVPFTEWSGRASARSSGWSRSPSGLIYQWGSGFTEANGEGAAVFLLPFESEVFAFNVTAQDRSIVNVQQGSITTDGFIVRASRFINSGTAMQPFRVGFTWFAIGV